MSDPPNLKNGESTAKRLLPGLAFTILSLSLVASCFFAGTAFLLFAFWTYLDSVEVFARMLQTQKDSIRHDAFLKMLIGCGFLAVPFIYLLGQYLWFRRKQEMF